MSLVSHYGPAFSIFHLIIIITLILMLNTSLQNYETLSSSSGSDGIHSRSFKPCCCYPDVNKLVCELKV